MSSSGNTSGRSRLNMRNISAVQRPMPRTCTRSAITSSSLICGQRCTCTWPSAKRRARSQMYSHFRPDSPQALRSFVFAFRTSSGETVETQSENRFHTLCAALVEICWPTMARASVRNGSPRGTRYTAGWRLMIAAMMGSQRQRARFARSQYLGFTSLTSGFIERQVQNQVLRFHPHHVGFVGRDRKVHRAAGDIAAHRAGLGELQREEREDAAHAPGVDLLPLPERVQDRARFDIEADVPGPVGFVYCFQRSYFCLQAQKMKNPGLHHTAQRIERGAAVGEADHRVVARLALPVERGVRAVEHVEIRLRGRALRLDNEPPQAAVLRARGVHLDGLQVGEQRVALLDGRLLLAKEELRGAQFEGVGAVGEDVAQDH